MKKKRFSIVIPVKDCSSTLKETLDSIKNQSFKNFEVVVVDDGSKDSPEFIVKKYNFNFVKLSENMGAAYARNIGAENSQGEYVVFLDGDIVLDKDALKNADDYIKKIKEANVFFGSFYPKLRFKNIFSQYKHLYLCYYYSKQGERLHTLDTSLTFIKRSIFNKFKFQAGIKISEDTELGMRLTKAGFFITNPKNILMEHIRYYSFKSFIKTDFVRGMRFSRLLLKSKLKDKKESGKSNFYLKPLNIYLNLGLVPLILLFLMSSLVFNKLSLYLLTLTFLLLYTLVNLEFWYYLKKINGLFFALKSSFITFFDALVMDSGISITFIRLLVYGKKTLE